MDYQVRTIRGKKTRRLPQWVDTERKFDLWVQCADNWRIKTANFISGYQEELLYRVESIDEGHCFLLASTFGSIRTQIPTM